MTSKEIFNKELTLYDYMISEMTSRGMFPQTAETVMQEIVNSKNFAGGEMQGKWELTASDYPMVNFIWVFVRNYALSYIDKNTPAAFYKPMFMDAASMERYKEENDFEGWLARRENSEVGKGARV